MAMKNPPHPGLLIQEDVMAPLGLSLSDATMRFDVEPDYLAAVLAGRKPLNITLAENLEKAGISTAKTWIALQETYDRKKQQ
ncbi:HigA family addiction module antidote protein [Alcaligenes faecalis]|uniref:HigA family addiction module antitoxin n=1 Tax=Alcaligenes faecalis TaxID=511 RepID=UPI000F691C86|nr:HigA family addiction module antitoxin [Alcaligenes faecalis]MBQ0218549.1 HigA family addiction module antidote protein [Alcaligenes faecalis]RSE60662.1 addiction module antidote protein, HigA family [Alcaligenes faecalis]